MAAGAVLCVPNQSDITNAVEAPLVAQHVVSSHACSLQYVPLSRLYADITAHAPASMHRGLERHERDLAQRALVDLGADRHALELGVVGDEVLHRARRRPSDCTPVMYADRHARR